MTTNIFPSRIYRSRNQALAFAVLAYCLGVVAIDWVNVAVLCRGDLKWGRGCGAFAMYAVFGVVMFAPVFGAGLVTARLTAAKQWRGLLYAVACAATLLDYLVLHIPDHSSLGAVVVGVGIVVGVVKTTSLWLGLEHPQN